MTNQQPANTDNNPVDKKLIHLNGEVKQNRRPNDINNKINGLEDSLNALQEELDVVNKSVEEGLDRLSDNDLDITAKVSETYKRLGEIDSTYKSLSKISDEIDSEVKKLALEMEEVAEQSASELGRLETRSSEQVEETNQQHEQLVARVNNLVEHSREANKDLTKSIKQNTDALLALEKQLAKEIDALANTTEQRDNEIANEVSAALNAIEKNRARILQLQSVDEALAKRATLLEVTAAEITDKSLEIETSVDFLEERSKDLTAAVGRLRDQNVQQASLITGLQKTADEITDSLLSLMRLEKYHFRTLSGALLMVLLLVATLFFYQQNITEENSVVTAAKNQVVDQNVVSLQQQSRMADAQITELQSDIEAVNSQLMDMNDQADSISGRLNRVSPFSQFGVDSVIHGPQWLANQPGNNFVIQLTTVSTKQELYEVAQRYSYYLKEQMAYYMTETTSGKQYMLTYGSFTNKADIPSVLYRMPRYINFQRPNVVRIADIHKV